MLHGDRWFGPLNVIMSSPYKKMKSANQSWIGYTNINKLDENFAYKMLGIVETNHPQFGPGQQATIEGHDGRKWRTQLPGKYLAQLSKDDIDTIKKDIANKKHVFLIYREKMLDNSYRIDITENDRLLENFRKHLEVPELEQSSDSEEEPSCEKNGNAEEKVGDD